MRFNPRFYVVALVFLIFDIETVFIFPWAVVLKGAGAHVLIHMMIFPGHFGRWPGLFLGQGRSGLDQTTHPVVGNKLGTVASTDMSFIIQA